MSNEALKNLVIDQVKLKKLARKQKWTEREYNIWEDADVVHKNIKIFFNTSQFPSLRFCGPHTKPHGVRGLSKYYHIIFDTKLGQDTCEISQIPCVCVKYTPMLDKHWVTSFPPRDQP